MARSAQAWGLVAVIVGAEACTLDTSGIGTSDTASPVDPSGTGTTTEASSGTTGTAGTAEPSTGVADATTAASGGDAPGTETGTTASVDTADTADTDPSNQLMRCNDEDFPIPEADLLGVASPIEIALEGTVVELRVAVQATHTWVGDLAFELRKDEAMLMVIEYPMACDGDDIDVLLHDEALATIDDSCHDDGRGVPALAGELLPESPLGPVFGGMSMAGTWRLRAIDNATQDPGTLTQWCLLITYR